MAISTHDIGRLFFYWMSSEHVNLDTKAVTMAPTWEVDPPFRKASSLVARIWLPRFFRWGVELTPVGVVLGWWQDSDIETRDEVDEDMGVFPSLDEIREDEAQAVADPEIDYSELSPGQKMTVRRNIAVQSSSLDAEMLMSQAMGLME